MEYMLVTAAAITALAIAMPIFAMHDEGRYHGASRLGRSFSPASSEQTTVTESYQRQQAQRLPDGTSTTTILPDPKGSTVFGKMGAGTRSVTTDDFSNESTDKEQMF